MPPQVFDGGRVEAVRIEGKDGDVRLTGRGRGQQVVDVHAAFEDDHAPPTGEQAECR